MHAQAADLSAREQQKSRPLSVQLKFREWQIQRAAEHARKRMARLRWQHAGLAVRLPTYRARKLVEARAEDDDDHLVRTVRACGCARACACG